MSTVPLKLPSSHSKKGCGSMFFCLRLLQQQWGEASWGTLSVSQCKLEVWVRGSLPFHTPPKLWLAGLSEVILGVASLCACVNGGISGCTCTVKELVFLAEVLWLCSM